MPYPCMLIAFALLVLFLLSLVGGFSHWLKEAQRDPHNAAAQLTVIGVCAALIVSVFAFRH